MIYMDYNATAPVTVAVQELALEMMNELGNPSSIHRLGQRVRNKIEMTRALIAQMIDVLPRDVVFTSGGTEANNLALTCLGIPTENILVGATEHKSILVFAPSTQRLKVDHNGVTDLGFLEEELRKRTAPALVSVMGANNETGVLQPLEAIAEICEKFNAFLHVDAVQTFGRLPVSLLDGKIHLLTLSAHKMGGLKGVGALISGPNLKMKAHIVGPGQERGLRAGTENTVGIASWAAALKDVDMHAWKQVEKLRDKLEERLCAVNPEAKIHGRTVARLPNTTCISSPRHHKEKQVIFFDLNGVAVSSGSACSSGRVAPSHVLEAMGCSEELASSLLRISLGPTTTEEEIEKFVEIYIRMIKAQ